MNISTFHVCLAGGPVTAGGEPGKMFFMSNILTFRKCNVLKGYQVRLYEAC